MRFFARSMFGLFLMALTAGLLMAAGYVFLNAKGERDARANGKREARERTFSVNVLPIIKADIAPIITAFGEVQSGRTLELRTASNGALVQMSDNFQEGAAVKKGELLFQTDPAAASATLELSKTEFSEAEFELLEARDALNLSQDELDAAKAQLDLRVKALERQQSLSKRGVGTASALESAELSVSNAQTAILGKRASLAAARARINRAETSLARNQINLDEASRKLKDLAVHAKFDGVLSGVKGVLGGLVGANERLGELLDPNSLEVSFRISSAQFNNLVSAEGGLNSAKVEVFFTGLSVPIPATVKRTGAAVGEGLTGREVFAQLQKDATKYVRPGDFVTVAISEPPLKSVARIPSTAATSRGEVLVLGAENRLEVATVDILRKQGDELIIFAPDLIGKSVVKQRAPQLGEGIKVEPRGDVAPVLEEQKMVQLSLDQQQQMSDFVKQSGMPEAVKPRILKRIASGQVPKEMFDRISKRMGG